MDPTLANIKQADKLLSLKSSFQIYQDKINEQIREFEEENIAPKPWVLGGEVSSRKRPINSLLEEVVEFDQSIKPVPIITPEVTETLEDIIKKRILEASWNDPILPHINRNLLSKKPLLELSTSRSKESLSSLYEGQYTQSVLGIALGDPLTSQKQAIEKLWKKLSHSLDALSHFHYTPKPDTTTSVTERPNVPSVMLEEALPLAMNVRSVAAPQEIHAPLKKPLKDSGELSREEKHSNHLQKKRDFKRKLKQRETTNEKLLANADGTLSKRKETKLVKEKALKSLATQKNVTVIGGGGGEKPNKKQKA